MKIESMRNILTASLRLQGQLVCDFIGPSHASHRHVNCLQLFYSILKLSYKSKISKAVIYMAWVKHGIGESNPTFLVAKVGNTHPRIVGYQVGAQWRQENPGGKQWDDMWCIWNFAVLRIFQFFRNSDLNAKIRLPGDTVKEIMMKFC